MANIVGSFWVLLVVKVMLLLVYSVMGKPALSGSFQTGLAVLADLLTAAGVLVVGSHIPRRHAASRYSSGT